MTSPRHLARPLVGLCLAGFALLSTSCAALLPQDLQVPKLYFKDHALTVTARQLGGTADTAYVDRIKAQLKASKTVGLTYTPDYLFTADPVLRLHTTVPIDMPASDLVEETQVIDGKEVKSRVLRQPIFYVDKTTITYQVPGYEIPPVVTTEQIPVKTNEYQLALPAVSQVAPLMSAYAADPGARGTIAGTMTVTVDIRDLDPLAAQRTLQVSRTLPLVYTYMDTRPE